MNNRLESGVALRFGLMRPTSEYIGGPEASARFDALVRKVLSVPHEEILRREADYKRQLLANPNRRGPKPNDKKQTTRRGLRSRPSRLRRSNRE